MTQENPQNSSPEDDRKRTISLLYGVADTGSPFWVFVAVRPANYQEFNAAYKENKLDLHNFKAFGEVIVCGDGKSPPDMVTLKVAEMYQTDAKTLMAGIKNEAR